MGLNSDLRSPIFDLGPQDYHGGRLGHLVDQRLDEGLQLRKQFPAGCIPAPPC